MRASLNGQVVGNGDAEIYRMFGFTDVCCPADLRKALEDCPEGEELELEINSGGGSVYAGFEMYSLLRNAGRPVTAEVQSIAASAMSVVIAGCDRVMMSPVANIMIHRASLRTEGNSETHTQRAQWLDTIDRSILEAYTRKCGDKATEEELAEMMERETFLTAEEAVEKGFADGILENASETADPLAAVASAYSAVAALGLGSLPPVDDLRQRMTEEGLTGAEGTPPVQNTGNAEKEREKDMTLEELMAEYPELMAQAANQAAEQAAAQERERIAAINALAMPGFEEQIQAAIDDPAKTAGDAAIDIVAAIKKSGGPSDWLANAREDAQTSGANAVGGAEQPGEKELTPEEEAEADAKAAMKTYKGEDK